MLRPRVSSAGQRRASDRAKASGSVNVTIPPIPDRVEGKLTNLSRTGFQLAVEAGACPSLREESTLQISLTDQIDVEGQVKWLQKDKRMLVVGGEWTDPLSFEKVWEIRSLCVPDDPE